MSPAKNLGGGGVSKENFRGGVIKFQKISRVGQKNLILLNRNLKFVATIIILSPASSVGRALISGSWVRAPRWANFFVPI